MELFGVLFGVGDVYYCASSFSFLLLPPPPLFKIKTRTWFDENQFDAMGVHKSPWAPSVFLEANKFWFYSIVLSLLLGIIQLWKLEFNSSLIFKKRKGVSEEQVEREVKEWKIKRVRIVRRLVIDGCDIFIPGFATGWMVVSRASVGMGSVVSTLLASMDIWERVQAGP
jgi:hypothetical protein